MEDKQVVIFIGPPGSGKDTQADLLVSERGFVPVPTSQIIRAKFVASPDDPVIQHEKEVFDAGKLNSSELVTQWTMEYVRPLAAQGKSLVFSGSPRTPHEGVAMTDALEELYGRTNILVIRLLLEKEEARRRISARRFCTAHNHPIPGTPEFEHLDACPQDGSPLVTRPLDDPNLVDTRFHEYHTLTEPVFDVLNQKGVAIFEVDASLPILAMHQAVVAIIERRLPPVPAV